MKVIMLNKAENNKDSNIDEISIKAILPTIPIKFKRHKDIIATYQHNNYIKIQIINT